MKRSYFILVIVSIIVSCFVCCGGDGSSPKNTTEKDVSITMPALREDTKVTETNPEKIEPKILDVFEGVEVIFEEVSPVAEASVNPSVNIEPFRIEYSVSPLTLLSIGDVVTVKASFSAENAEKLGYIVPGSTPTLYSSERMEIAKEFIVENVDVYIESFAELNPSDFDVIIDIGKECIYEIISAERDASFFFNFGLHDTITNTMRKAAFNEPELVSMYFAFNEKGLLRSTVRSYNKLYCVFKISALPENETEYGTVFMSIEYPYVIRKADGSIDASYPFDLSTPYHHHINIENVYDRILFDGRHDVFGADGEYEVLNIAS
jgi:hypothetical protein